MDTNDLQQWHMCTCIREGHYWLTMTYVYMYMYKRGTLLTYNNDICVHV